MRERPLLANSQVALAIPEGRQTQDRRPIKIQPAYFEELPAEASVGETAIYKGELWQCYQYSKSIPDAIKWRLAKAPHQVGDLLYVREGWRCTGGGDLRNIIYRADGDSPMSFCGIDDGRDEILKVPEPHWAEWDRLVYKTSQGCNWRPNIHMPKWAARTWVKVLRVWVEQIQDISIDDVLAEGIESFGWDYAESSDDTGDMFMYWDNQNGDPPKWADWITSCECIEDIFRAYWNFLYPGTWDKNIWVWVTEFEIYDKENKLEQEL